MDMTTKKIACIIGTRPEIIKMAPIIKILNEVSWAQPKIIATAQHRQMLDELLVFFGLEPDYDLNIMRPYQSLGQLSARLIAKLTPIFEKENFDAVLVQGDTTTVLASALVGFYHKVPVGHVEAGLRTFDMYEPFPEEMNRLLVSKLATWHFVPTFVEKDILQREGITDHKIFVTGNTVIDSLLATISTNLAKKFVFEANKKVILVTLHRRETFLSPLKVKNIANAIQRLLIRFPDVEIIIPMHPNPEVRTLLTDFLESNSRLQLIEPLAYPDFVALMQQSYLILTDSGGIQEEAPALAKPVLVLRDKTERPLIISEGLGQMVGTEEEAIVTATETLLTDAAFYQSMIKFASPYGKGDAAKQICSIIRKQLMKDSKAEFVETNTLSEL